MAEPNRDRERAERMEAGLSGPKSTDTRLGWICNHLAAVRAEATAAERERCARVVRRIVGGTLTGSALEQCIRAGEEA